MKAIKISMAALASVILLCNCSSPAEKPKTAETPGPENIDKAPVAVKGDEVYKKSCVACHQANGEGIAKTFPPLAKSDFLANKEKVIEQVIKGKNGEIVVNGEKYNNVMPPQNLSDDEIAAVLSYVYTSWGNAGSLVTIDEVKAMREKLAKL